MGLTRVQLTGCLPCPSFEVQVAAPERWEQEYVRNTSWTAGPKELDVALFRLAQATLQTSSVPAFPPEGVPAVQDETRGGRADAAAASAHGLGAPGAQMAPLDLGSGMPVGMSGVELGWSDVGLGEERERRRAEEVARLDAEHKSEQRAQASAKGARLDGFRQGDAHAGNPADSLPNIVDALLRDDAPTPAAGSFAGQPLLHEHWRRGKRRLLEKHQTHQTHQSPVAHADDSAEGSDGGKDEGKCKAVGERDAIAAAAHKRWNVEQVASCIQAYPKYCDVSCAGGWCECRWQLSSHASSIAAASSLGRTPRPEDGTRRGALN